MSSCALRRWGPGTTCERLVVTEKTKELEDRLKARMAERDQQLNFWDQPASDTNKISGQATTMTQTGLKPIHSQN